MWSQGDVLSYPLLVSRITGEKGYDLGDLTQLLRKDQRVELQTLIKRVVDGFRFLGNPSELEALLLGDQEKEMQNHADRLMEHIRKMHRIDDASP
jgi:hypothetical protein